jgi:hypothetical protein
MSKLRDFLRTEIKSDELVRGLVVIGPLVVAYMFLRELAIIWSAASVVVGDLSASGGKLKLRAIGAFVGVPLGLLVGMALPKAGSAIHSRFLARR